MNILEIIGNKLNAVAVWIARLREPETPYAAAKPSPNPIMNPITEFSEDPNFLLQCIRIRSFI